MRGRPEAVPYDAGAGARRGAVDRDVGDQRRRSILGFAGLLIREHGGRKGSHGDRPCACPWRVCLPEGETFRGSVVDADDDSAQLVERFGARSVERG